jgi:zinc protease
MMPSLFTALLTAFLIFTPAFAGGPGLGLTPPDQLQYRPLHFQVPKPARIVLDNGMILYHYEDHELPLIKVTALVGTGSVYDPEGKEGLAELTGQVMREGGTRTMKSAEIDETLERLAIDLEASLGSESGTVGMSVLKKDLDAGLDIFSRIIREPVFEEAKTALAVNLKLEDIRRIADNPQRFAFREFNRLIYRNHPRGRLASLASVKTIRREDLLKFHERFFRPANIMIAVSGDITKDEAVKKINGAFGSWRQESPPVADPPPIPKQQGGVYFIAKNTPQSVVLIGQRAPARLSEEAYPFSVFDFIIGSGGFPSRIFQEVRTNQGLAYSAGSFYRPRSTDGVFGAYALTKSATTLKALSVLRAIVRDDAHQEISAQELAWAKKSIDNGFIFSFTSASQIAYQQMKIEYDRLPEDYLTTYRGKIEKVGLADLARVRGEYVLPDEEIILVVGNDEALMQVKSVFRDITTIEGRL